MLLRTEILNGVAQGARRDFLMHFVHLSFLLFNLLFQQAAAETEGFFQAGLAAASDRMVLGARVRAVGIFLIDTLCCFFAEADDTCFAGFIEAWACVYTGRNR